MDATTLPPDLRVAVVGVGVMGADHVERLATRTKFARVSVVNDFDTAKASRLAGTVPGCRAVEDPFEAITADDVDAVLLASPGRFHAEQVLAALEIGRPVLCEKPLALDPADALQVVRREAEHGSPLVSVGFMRRFDREHEELRASLAAGELGTPLMVHCKHRNASVPGHFDDRMMVYDSAVHEVDSVRYLLGEEIVSASVLKPTPSENAPAGLHDPMLVLFRTASGRVVTDELHLTTSAGYEVRTEVVGSRGSATIGLEVGRLTTQLPGGRWGGSVHADFRPRFRDAYDVQLQRWVDAVRRGEGVDPTSATAWDGYAAAVVCEATARALDTDGAPVPVELATRPPGPSSDHHEEQR
ncbi:Gfo/Idh/MocA family protein [Auraticoccus monumenti]|uniref:Inositol 2-dehydrogenase n=1 Tax=Auraticoccus monumenti TaxID=675864 RepID=A0A1G6YC36_9ACTN|nr:Gfo/Idh/MocA family oxidoreductase [Auraticoccus monumenti]SDD87892.1 myo-inositol 2-dehydrogenase [Auraticoccus monumenti]